jgi:predicted transcriptional regulator
MNQENMTLTLDSEKKEALSAIATLMERDFSDVVNEAIATYLEMNQWLLAEIRNSLKKEELGEYIDETKIQAMFAELTSKSIYRDGTVELVKTLTGVNAARVTIALSPRNGCIELQSRGINREQAANLRARLQSFAEDWNCPEMDVYDAL